MTFDIESQQNTSVKTSVYDGGPCRQNSRDVADLGAHSRAIDPLLGVRLTGLLLHNINAELCQPLDCRTDAACPSHGIKACVLDILCL